jgi:hypothetical protein
MKNTAKILNRKIREHRIVSYWYPLTDTESLILREKDKGTTLAIKYEIGDEREIGYLKTGRWTFRDYSQQQEFFGILTSNRIAFQKALKYFWKHQQEKPWYYQVTCLHRRFKLQVIHLKRNVKNW